MEPISLALVIDSLYGGGAEKAVLTLMRTMRNLGHRAQVISLSEVVHYDLDPDDEVHQIDSAGTKLAGLVRSGLLAKRLASLIARLERENGQPFSAVISHLPVSSRVVSHCAFPRTFHCIHTSIKGMLQDARRRSIWHYLAQRARWRALDGQHLIAVSRGLEAELVTSKHFRPASTRTIHNPYDLARIRRLARAETADIPREGFVIHVGRAARMKRLDLLMEAFRLVDEPIKLVMLSNHPRRVERTAASYGLAHRVIVRPFQQNPYAWMARARLLVLSSDFEGFSNVMLEALACGTPVVARDCPYGPAEILTGELDRWLVPMGDGAELGAKINEALDTDIDVSNADVLGRVDAERVAKRYLALADQSTR
jgi:glycosyltransferase involved in cell wall biosynthesis